MGLEQVVRVPNNQGIPDLFTVPFVDADIRTEADTMPEITFQGARVRTRRELPGVEGG